MINIREARFWTALLVMGLCALTMSWALPTLQFGLASQWADARSAGAVLAATTGRAPVGPLAQRLWLQLGPPHAAKERVAALQTLLAAMPLSGGAWLDLAIARKEAGAPMQDVSSALAMSALTGPNEARFMAGRAFFGLPIWDQLPPDFRRTLIGDLVGGWSELGWSRAAALSAILTVASDQSRTEILAMLLLWGPPGEPIIKALDLAPPPVEGGEPGRAGPGSVR